MKYLDDYSNILVRYDFRIAVARQSPGRVTGDEVLQRVADAVVNGDANEADTRTREALESKAPWEVIDEGLIPGMKEVSRLWDEGVYFLPHVMLASDAMNVGIALCEEKMGTAREKKAKVITHTAEGDIHDIGQVIVNALLNSAGFDVINLGADVPVEKVVDACRTHNPVMLTGTALMTTTMTAFPRIAAELQRLGIEIPFVCGGGAVNEEFVTSFDLGIWGREASQAPAMANDALSGEDWREMRRKWNG